MLDKVFGFFYRDYVNVRRIRRALLVELSNNRSVLLDLLEKIDEIEIVGRNVIKGYKEALTDAVYQETIKSSILSDLPKDIRDKLACVYTKFKTIREDVIQAIVVEGMDKGGKIRELNETKEQIKRTLKLLDDVYKGLSRHWRINC